jgi:ornithine carbamoyltransferase
MKRYIKDGIIKTRNQIVIKGQRTIKDKDGNDKVVGMNTYNPTEEMILADGWVEYTTPVYEPTEEEIANREKAFEIRNAKAELANSDYKIIKCMEAYLCGEELPYNITELHAERNTKRNKINELEHAE